MYYILIGVGCAIVTEGFLHGLGLMMIVLSSVEILRNQIGKLDLYY